MGVLCALLTLVFDLPTGGAQVFSLTLDQMIRIGYLCLACTLFAQFAQMFGQKYTTPNQTSIILTFEAVFGVVFAVILGGEDLTTTLIIGFIVIFISVLISEVDVDYSKIFKLKKK